MSENQDSKAVVVAVSISSGGVPKIPQQRVRVTRNGLEGDGRDHKKHNKPERAVSLFDEEILEQLRSEGYELEPGSIGENVLVRGLDVQKMAVGTILRMGEVSIRLEEPRKPCFVLDTIDPKLKDDIVGRSGYMASVVEEGELTPGTPIEVA